MYTINGNFHSVSNLLDKPDWTRFQGGIDYGGVASLKLFSLNYSKAIWGRRYPGILKFAVGYHGWYGWGQPRRSTGEFTGSKTQHVLKQCNRLYIKYIIVKRLCVYSWNKYIALIRSNSVRPSGFSISWKLTLSAFGSIKSRHLIHTFENTL